LSTERSKWEQFSRAMNLVLEPVERGL
jgi:hypothetical protein